MPPALRSSAPSTPRASTRTTTPATDSEPAALTPRKSPHCKTCGRPRKGHPLRSCDADPPIKSPIVAPSPRSNNLVEALEAMNLEDRDRKEKRERRKSAQQQRPKSFPSLPSISTFTGELLDSLMVPGVLDDDESDHGGDDSKKREAVIRWREKSGVPSGTGTSQKLVEHSGASPSSLDSSPDRTAEESTPTKKRNRGAVGK
ncbi:hypothetical protein DFH08DRAFT_832768 [Mycena albidolilacea]|uniref:Uncharacterized protein n=1 Tax=Mycena albidolilacea TaxID=1033008 RepID=A0AAD7F7C3_9AGAR|nr:hypothetical protein DFH08DRAFT_832768 [Mycena albidolilacea]